MFVVFTLAAHHSLPLSIARPKLSCPIRLFFISGYIPGFDVQWEGGRAGGSEEGGFKSKMKTISAVFNAGRVDKTKTISQPQISMGEVGHARNPTPFPSLSLFLSLFLPTLGRGGYIYRYNFFNDTVTIFPPRELCAGV